MRPLIPTANYAAPNYDETPSPAPMYKLGDRVRTHDGRFDLAREYTITGVHTICVYELDGIPHLVEQQDIIKGGA